MTIETIWGAFPFEEDDDTDDEDDDARWRRTHGLNERGEFEGWQAEDLKHA